MLVLVIQHHPHRTATHLSGKLVRCLARHDPILSGVGVSGKPGAVQTAARLRRPTSKARAWKSTGRPWRGLGANDVRSDPYSINTSEYAKRAQTFPADK